MDMKHLLEATKLNMSINTTSSAASSSTTSSPIKPILTPNININSSSNSMNDVKSSEKLNENRTEIKSLKNRDVVITSLIAGAIAGALAKTTIAPFDRTKINFQINKDKLYSFRAALRFLTKTYHREGFFALWRGNSATMARIIPYAAIQFTAHEQWRKLLQVDIAAETEFRRFLAGSLAGITSQSLTYPLDLARARMAVTDKGTLGNQTLRQVFVSMWVKESPRSLFRGYWATILGVIPYAGTSFFTYDTLKHEYYKYTGEKKPTTLFTLLFGATAGVMGQTSSYPLDIVRRRLQTNGLQNSTDQYVTVVQTIKKIYREEGIIKGFYKGLSMNWIKGPIAVGISFATYDHIKVFLREKLPVQNLR